MSGLVKSLAALAVVVYTWVNHTLSPLFWLLLVLVVLDLLLNIHQEGKQLPKLGSTFFALGLPAFLSSHSAHLFDAEVLKGVVCILTLGYVWVVVPQLFALVNRWLPKTSQAQAAALEQTAFAELVSRVKAEIAKESPDAAATIAQATTGPTSPDKTAQTG